MATQTTALTAVSNTLAFSLQPGQSATYSSSGTFTGYVSFKRSRSQGATWETIAAPAVDTNFTSATVKNETNAEERFRFELYDTDAVTPVTGTCTTVVADALDTVKELTTPDGRVFLSVTDDGVVIPGTVDALTSVKVAGVKVLGAQAAAQADTAAATATAIAQGAATAASTATATAIAAAVPAAAPAGGTGAAAGGWDTAANRDLAIVTINDLRTHAVEMDLDYEAVLVDVADIRTKFNVAVLHTAELDLDYEALLVDVAALRVTVNALLAKLRTHGVIAT